MTSDSEQQIPVNIAVLCTYCKATWITTMGCVCDCLCCGSRIVNPSFEELRTDELANARKQLKRIK